MLLTWERKPFFCSWKEGKGMDYMDSWLVHSSYGAVCGLWICFNFQVHLLSSASSMWCSRRLSIYLSFLPLILELEVLPFEATSFPKSCKAPAGPAGKGPAVFASVWKLMTLKTPQLLSFLSPAHTTCCCAEAHTPVPKAFTFFFLSFLTAALKIGKNVLVWFLTSDKALLQPAQRETGSIWLSSTPQTFLKGNCAWQSRPAGC